MKKIMYLLVLLGFLSAQAKIDTCLLKAVLIASRSIQKSESEILGKVCTIEDITIEALEKMCDALETITSCNPTPVSMPITITESGPYCLTQSIMGDITIAVNSVVLDLNGYTLSGGVNVNNQSEVIIQNGFIGTAGAGCVMLSNCSKVEVKNVFFSDSAVGISIANSNLVVLKECNFVGQASFAVTTTATSNMKLKDLKASQCGTAFSIATGNTIGIISCEAAESTADGFLFDNSAQLQVINCISNESAGNAFSFINSCTDAQISNSIGSRSGSGHGYLLENASSFQFTNCQASNNLTRGFSLTSGGNISFNGCNSNLNTGRGYSFSGVNNININNSTASSNGEEGYDFDECDSINIKNSVASLNAANGGFCFGICRSIEISGSAATQNTGNGFLFNPEQEDLLVFNSFASQNTSVGFAVFVTLSATRLSRHLFDSCVSESNGADGFLIQQDSSGTPDWVMVSCQSLNNGVNGFSLFLGGGGAARGNFISNIAIGNVGFGFNSTSTMYFAVNNYAVDNGGGNFFGAALVGPGPIPIVGLGRTIGFWTNVG